MSDNTLEAFKKKLHKRTLKWGKLCEKFIDGPNEEVNEFDAGRIYGQMMLIYSMMADVDLYVEALLEDAEECDDECCACEDEE